MGVAWLLPTLRRPSLDDVAEDFSHYWREGDELVMSDEAGMMPALRHCFVKSKAPIVRNCADDDRYPLEGNRLATGLMEADPTLDVLVTGGIKTLPSGSPQAICVPRGAQYGSSCASVAQYGACGSGLFMRRDAVLKYGLLDYDGRLIDNYIVLKAIASGAKVRFARLDTYRHRISLRDEGQDYDAFLAAKRALRASFGVGAVRPLPHEAPPVWDGEFA